jgi:hypothetical protein
MKTRNIILIIAFTFALYAKSFAEDNTNTNQSVWAVSFIKSDQRMDIASLNSLKATWRAVQDEAVKQELIVSYSILNEVATATDFYNLVFLVEYKSPAAMQGQDAKWEAIQAKVGVNDEALTQLNNIRTPAKTTDGQTIIREAFMYSILSNIKGIYPQKPGC